eukprot:gnl/TRDRNA2_/TRDRNA2_157657_c0_seq1.p1 gnl/TRDRNA2_/TRDRNA2_157657_c0~~gnl/TRDRNA2_/TRDRNA2_157657_c0_seq1.p1  ORF type:complete len:447 (-),score=91.82 gnl/TRDRNA2_/TRDRNA2_157657_c0_seq1:80-1420(-)
MATAALKHFAGRGPAGSTDGSVVGPTLRKRGIRHVRLDPVTGEERETYVIGGACSEVFTGKRLAEALTPSADLERRAIQSLAEDDFAETLSVHTSAGVPPQLMTFLDALAPHLPWPANDDWVASVQLEGGTAVFAGIDLLMQLQRVRGHTARTKIAVAERSYHGPAATSPGAPAAPLFPKDFQVTYPAPTAFRGDGEEVEADFVKFLDAHAAEVSVLLVEPQWGSSNAAKPWPKALLKRFIDLAHERGILVLCDEIMCGLGRHGNECIFLSKAWELDVDAVTFGKAMATGVFPLSGVIMKQGTAELRTAGKGVMHMHTYAGSSALALVTAIEVLRMVPSIYGHVAAMGKVMSTELAALEKETGGFVSCFGQGLMWGGLFAGSDEERAKARVEFKRQCLEAGVWPYFIPVGGFMIVPPLDVTEEDLREALQRMAGCVKRTYAALADA